MTAVSTADAFEAEVIAAFGRHLLVRSGTQELRARPAGRRLSIVCGDRVRCEVGRTHDEVMIVEVLPRRTLLARANLRGESEPVVANITRLVVVVAPVPEPDFFIVDRYLCAATAAGIAGAVAVNKSDLEPNNLARAEIDAFIAAGYAHVSCSATLGHGLVELRALLAGAVSVLVGQSGVGKSSLVNALLPQMRIQIETDSLMREEEGRHTTTASRSYPLDSGGTLIDSPGVRDFAPAIEQLDAQTLGFPEVDRLAAGCRFQDCKHMQEPACAVMAAVERGELAARRYESYRRLRRRYADLVEARGPAKRGRR
ncbi:MAG TPA: ribosome small subunit-dependent GTPase A [Steroidobacteraceae bacterium]|jgi:ribosome biogenesis GTPase|nr:ribosome small subunit-dependent GTPase A [Steroidobacteraceae bacterium]